MGTIENSAGQQPALAVEAPNGMFDRMRQSLGLRAILPGAVAISSFGVALAYTNEDSASAANLTNQQVATGHQFESSTTYMNHTENQAGDSQLNLIIKVRKHLLEGKYAKVLIHDFTKPTREITTIDGKLEKHFTVERYMDYTQVVLVPKGSHVFRVYMGKDNTGQLLAHKRLVRKK